MSPGGCAAAREVSRPLALRWSPSVAAGAAVVRSWPMQQGAERRGMLAANSPALRRAIRSTTGSRRRNSTIVSRPRAELRAAPAADAPHRARRRPSPPPYRVASLAPQLPYQRPAREDQTTLVSLKSSAFPYLGNNPRTEEPFLNVSKGGRRGHRGYGGRVFWQDETFNDNRVLMHVPESFDVRKPGVIVVFFHGNGATLERDVRDRQLVPQQISESGVNAVLLAPQLAVDAADSSAGKFWQPGGLQALRGRIGRSSRRTLRRSARRQGLRQHAGRSSSATAAASCRRPGASRSAASATACAACSCSMRSMANWTSSRPGSRTTVPAFSSVPIPATPSATTTN